jgi:hypothetical protein
MPRGKMEPGTLYDGTTVVAASVSVELQLGTNPTTRRAQGQGRFIMRPATAEIQPARAYRLAMQDGREFRIVIDTMPAFSVEQW